MENTIANFFKRLHRYPNGFQAEQLNGLLDGKTKETLVSSGLLVRDSDLKEVLCSSCDDGHFLPVRVSSEGKPYCVCPHEDTDRNYLSEDEIAVWTFDTAALLNILCSNLDIHPEVEKLSVEGLWQVGQKNEDLRHCFYYFQGRKESELFDYVESQPEKHHRYIVLCAKRLEHTFAGKHEIILLEIKDFLKIGKAKVSIVKSRFEKYLKQELRNVFFDDGNGELKVNGKLVIEVPTATPEFYFVEALWNKFNYPVSHRVIKSYILDKLGKTADSTTPPVYNRNLKRNIKEKYVKDIEIFNKLIIRAKISQTENGYRIRNIES